MKTVRLTVGFEKELSGFNARLVPVTGESCSSRDLAEDLAGTKPGIEDRQEMGAAVRKGRKQLESVKNP